MTAIAELPRRGAAAAYAEESREESRGDHRVGLVIVQMDGVSRPEIERLLAMRRLPVLGGLLRSGRLELGDWRPLLPPSTPASQAGILHGRNDGIPGFRWYEKDTRRLVIANHAHDAALIERRTSDGHGLLAGQGVSIGNLLAGDSGFSHLTMATIELALDDARDGHDLGERLQSEWSAAPCGRRAALAASPAERRDVVRFTLDPRTWVAIVIGSIRELVDEIRGARRQRRDDVRPRMRRGWRYAIERVLTNVPLRILSTELVRAEIRHGRPVIYVDFTGYDEIAHHCGPGREETWRAAERIDASLGRIVDEIDQSRDRRYGLVVLSDHGQSLGWAFRQRFGRTLEEEIAATIGRGIRFHGATDHSEYDNGLARLAQHLLGRRIASGVAGLMEQRPGTNHHRPSRIVDSRGAPLSTPADAQHADVVVCASGNLGLVYLTSIAGRATREAIDARYPQLIPSLVAHRGIDLVAVRSSRGLVVLGTSGVAYLDEGRVEGQDPLAGHGALAADGLRRIAGFDHGGDLILIGRRDPATGLVISFEELVGSHGGLGGEQEQPFFAAPATWPRLERSPIGAPAVNRQLRAWLERLPELLDDAQSSPSMRASDGRVTTPQRAGRRDEADAADPSPAADPSSARSGPRKVSPRPAPAPSTQPVGSRH